MLDLKEEDFEIVNQDEPDHGIRYLYLHTHRIFQSFSLQSCELLKNLILKNQNDAKKWTELENSKTHEALVQYAKDRQIVKRLEAKLKECKENAGGMEFGLELQKILEGKK